MPALRNAPTVLRAVRKLIPFEQEDFQLG